MSRRSIQTGVFAAFLTIFTFNGISAFAGGFTETITSVTLPPDPVLIASAGARSRVTATCEVDIEQTSGGVTGAVYRVLFQLLDETGTAIPLANADSANGLSKWSAVQTVVAPNSPGTIISRTFTAQLEPLANPGLSLANTYHFQSIVQQQNSSGTFVNQGAPMASNSELIEHFKSTTSGDAALNSLAKITQVQLTDHWLRTTDTNDGFNAEVLFDLHRFDDFSDPLSTNLVEVVFDVTLHSDAPGFPSIPLVKSSWTSSYSMISLVEGPPLDVYERNNLTRNLHIRPADGEQLQSRANLHFLTITIRHDDGGGSTVTGNTQNSSTDRLLQFNGTLFFDLFNTQVTDLANDPATTLYATNLIGLAMVFEINAGESVNHPGFTYGDGSPMNVVLRNNGDAIALSGAGYTLTPPTQPDADEVAHVRFKRDNIVMDAGGLTAGTLTVQLPTGMGYTFNRFDAIQESDFALPNQALNINLHPKLPQLTASFPTPIYVTEEAHPLQFETDVMSWEVSTGRFIFDNDAVHYIRTDEIYHLITGGAPSTYKIPQANDLYNYYVASSPIADDVVIDAHTNRSARLTANLPLSTSGNFAMHFPLDTRINWLGGGTLSISNDLFVAGSELNGITSAVIPYRQDCSSSPACPAASEKFAELRFSPGADRFLFTPDGGLYAAGTLNASTNRYLAWGFIEASGEFAHRTDAFNTANFVMGGVHLTPENGDGRPANAPGILMHSGWDVTSATAERPGTPSYIDGNQNYAGINVLVPTTGSHQALSTLGGTPVGLYDLTDRSKFYARAGGVSGILEADPAGFPGTTTIWGYPFDFSTFALSYLSNVNEKSRTDGSLDLPDPAGFTLPFENLGFTCLGALTDAEIAGGGPLRVLMTYWNADVDIHSMRFETPADCDPGTGYLVTGAGGFVHPIPNPLYGDIGFRSNGNIITQGDDLIEGLTSRLTPPTQVDIQGPGDQTYSLTPVTGAWYDNHGNLLKPATGRINLAGMLDIPYFDDMRTHIRASSREADPVGSQDLAGGWTQGGNDLFFITDFDPDNFGLPFGVNETTYLSGGNNDAYRMHARKDWWDSIVFDYPLEWNKVARTFRSATPKKDTFLVIDTEHELTYMDADQAEIIFGAQYDGLPQINLANMAYNAATEQTGMLESLIEAANQDVADGLVDWIDALREVLDDQYDEIVTELLDTTTDPVIDAFYLAMNDYYDPEVSNTFATLYTTINETAFNSANSLNDHLYDLFTGAGTSATILDSLSDRVQRGQNALLAVMDETSFQGTYNGTLLTQDSGGKYIVLGELADTMLHENANLLRTAFGELDPITQWDVLLTEIITQDASGLDNARTRLRELYDALEAIQNEIDTAGDIVAQIQVLVSPASIDLITTGVVNDMNAFLLSIEADLYWDEYSSDEIKELIRTSIDDQIYQSAMLADIQTAVKHRIYDIEAEIGSTIDSVFASVNRSLRELTREYLTPIDNSWNDFAGELNGVVRGADLSGYAHLSDDALRKLRMDLLLELNMVDPMTFHGYLEICEQSSDGDEGCNYNGEAWKEAVIGATGVPLNMVGAKNMKLDAQAKFTFDSNGYLVGLGGGLDLAEGELKFSGLTVETFGAAFMMGEEENYFGGKAGIRFNGTSGYGGMFFGRSCTLAPLESIDPVTARIIGQAPFTGIYGYGEAHVPIINAGCLFNVSVGAGLGAFVFTEGTPTVGGRMSVAGSGKALCLAQISGRADLQVGLKGNDVFFEGTGRFEGKGGICPLCIKFNKSVTFTYDEKWKVKF